MEYLEDKKKLNEVQKSAMDFPTYFDAMLRRIKAEYGDDYTDFGSTSVGVMLVHVMSYGLSQLAWYLDRRTSDLYLDTARTTSAVTKIARQIGYKVKPATSSTVDLSLAFEALQASGTIPRGFKFQGPNSLIFESTSDLTISAAATSATINVSEGESRTLTFASDGTSNQRFELRGILSDQHLADKTVTVYVDGAEWIESEFLTFDKTNQYEVSYTTDPPFVLFGDGKAGNVPMGNASVRVEYRVINGALGNVNANTITAAIDTFRVLTSAVGLTVTNSRTSSGGADPQSIAEVKSQAPKFFAARNSAVTLSDYNTLSNSFVDPTYGTPSKAYAYAVRSSSEDAIVSSSVNAAKSSTGGMSSAAVTTQSAVSTETTSIAATQAAISSSIAAMTADVSTIDGERSGINTQNVNITGAAAGLSSSHAQMAEELTAMVVTMEALVVAGGLTKSGYLELMAHKAALNSFVTTATSSTASVQGSSTNITSTLTNISSALASITSQLSAVTTSNSGLTSSISSVTSSLSSLVSTASTSMSAIDANLDAITSHLTGLFSDDCSSNVVLVPIVSKGANGFYASPSSGLIKALQAYLDGVKEVTQDVKVIDGGNGLLLASIQVKFRPETRLVESRVQSSVSAAIDSVLKDREFNETLYLSDLYDATEPVRGLTYINIKITGPGGSLDPDGNLVAKEFEVVTKGAVTLTAV